EDRQLLGDRVACLGDPDPQVDQGHHQPQRHEGLRSHGHAGGVFTPELAEQHEDAKQDGATYDDEQHVHLYLQVISAGSRLLPTIEAGRCYIPRLRPVPTPDAVVDPACAEPLPASMTGASSARTTASNSSLRSSTLAP